MAGGGGAIRPRPPRSDCPAEEAGEKGAGLEGLGPKWRKLVSKRRKLGQKWRKFKSKMAEIWVQNGGNGGGASDLRAEL